MAKTQAGPVSVSIALEPGTPPDVVAAVDLIARAAVRRLGHAGARSTIGEDDGRPVVVIDGLLPSKGLNVAAAAVRGAIDDYLAACP